MFRKLLATVVIGLMPGLAIAGGCFDHGEQAMSCADGTVWDPQSRTCVTQSLT